jgi:hypothetical protein
MQFATLKLMQFAQLTNCPPGSGNCKGDTNLPQIAADSNTLQVVLQLLFGILAAMAVIYIIIAAIKYSVSLGNPQATKTLRGTIIYAGVGLAVALLAEFIVTFTLGNL